MALCALFSSPAWAQTPSSQQPSYATAADPTTRRPARPRPLSSATPAFGTSRPVKCCRRAAGRSAAIGPTGIAKRRSPTSRTSVARLRFGASDRVELFGNVDVQRRIDADRRPVRAGGTPDGRPVRLPGVADRLRRHPRRRQVQHHWRRSVSSRRRSPSARSSSCRRPTRTKGSAPASSTSWPTPSSAAKRRAMSNCQASAASCYRGDPGRVRAEQRIPLGLRRRLPEPRPVPRHDRTHRRDVLRRRDRVQRLTANGTPASWEVALARRLHHRLHLSGNQRLLHRLRRVVSA